MTERELAQQALDLKAQHGSFAEAARQSGIAKTTLKDRAAKATALGLKAFEGADPNTSALVESLRAENDRLKGDLQKATKPKFVIRTDQTSQSSKVRVVCIGDAHDSPEIEDKSRFEWIGKYINQTKPDIVIQIGDFATLDSLNTHVPNETYAGKSKPTFMRDMESFNLALDAMQLNDGIERHCTLGNHERRLWLFEERAPEAYGMMQFELSRIFERHKWTMSPYGAIHYVGGVGFVHAPLNRLGKTVGGKNAENTVANELIHDLVFGHSHVERTTRYSKIGANNYVISCNVGCALPDRHVEKYAEHSMSGGWSWGVMDLEIQHGHIQGRSWVPMERLGEMYGGAHGSV